MANNVTKFIDVTGDKMSLKVIELACRIAFEQRRLGEEARCMGLANALAYMDCDFNAVTRHGWAEITNYTVEDTKRGGEQDIVSITTLTPYGNLEEVMAELREHFPLCEFHCFNMAEEENEFD